MSDLKCFDDLRLGVDGDGKLPANHEEILSETLQKLKQFY